MVRKQISPRDLTSFFKSAITQIPCLPKNKLCYLSNLTFKETDWECSLGLELLHSILEVPSPAPQKKGEIQYNHSQSFLFLWFHFIIIQKLISLTSQFKPHLFTISLLFSSILALKGQDPLLGSCNCVFPLLHLQCAFVWGPILPCEKQSRHRSLPLSSSCLDRNVY